MRKFLIFIFSFIAVLNNPIHAEYSSYDYDSAEFSSFDYTSGSVEDRSLNGVTLTTENGNYLLEKIIGAGAFGDVYRATNDSGATVAVKLFVSSNPSGYTYFITRDWPTQFPDDPSIYAVFLSLLTPNKEWENGLLFNHPNIISILDKGTGTYEDGLKYEYIVYEYVDGDTVGNIDDHSISKEDALKVAIEFLQSQSYGLAFEKIYFDLHPWNFMISNDHTFKVLDIGSFLPLEIYETGFRKDTTMSRHFRRMYWIVKEILRRGDFSEEEFRNITSQLKEPVQKIFSLKINKDTLSNFDELLQDWIAILNSSHE